MKLILTLCMSLFIAQFAQAGLKSTTIQGLLIKMVVAEGSKSERTVLAVQVSETEAIPVRPTGSNPFQIDKALSKSLHRNVECSGFIMSGQLINAECKRLD